MSREDAPVAVTLRLYRALASVFPSEFRNVYGDEMLDTAQVSAELIWRRYGVPGLIRLLFDIALRLPAEYASELRRDAGIGVRMLAASPGFTAVAIVSLTLGIGIATSAYSEMNGLLRNLPGVPNPDELVALRKPVSYPAYQRFSQLHDLFSDSAAYVPAVPLTVPAEAQSERVWGHLVTPSYFHVLGAQPLLGRFFDAAYDRPGQAAAAVVSHRFWQVHLGADPSVIGKAVRINGHPCTIIGVGRKEFAGASPALFPADVWLPATVEARIVPELRGGALEQPDRSMFQMIGRLRSGTSEARAHAELNAVAEQIAEFHEDRTRDNKTQRIALVGGGRVLPLRKQDVPYFRQFLMVMGGLILVIACANVANMMLARAADRRREIAVRLAMGAGRARLVRQLLTESFLLAAAAAAPAFVLCFWIMDAFSKLKMPLPIPVAIDLRPDWRALLFLISLTGFTALAFGLAPALQTTRTDLVSTLKEGGIRLRKHRALSLRNVLLFSQMAASLMLLMMTGYLGLGIQSTLGVQEGFNAQGLYLVSVDPIRDGYPPDRVSGFVDKLLERLRSSAAVSAVCLTDTLPASVDGNAGVAFFSSGGKADGSRDARWARKHIVGRRYFETAGIQILSGREFGRQDETDGAATIIVSQEAVRRFWRGENPVGRRIDLVNGGVSGSTGLWPGSFDYRTNMLSKAVHTFEVIGVASDVSEDIVSSKRHPAVYFPLRRSDLIQPSLRGLTLMVRGTPGADVIGIVRREIASTDSRITPFSAHSMVDHIAQFMSMLKAASWTYGVMGLFGLVLASVGLAGVTAYSVAQRAREIGIRMALGAQKGDVLKLVMKEGAVLVALGSAAGLLLAFAGMRALSGVFFTVATVNGYSPVLLVGAPLLLASVALFACYLPARRSTCIDPARTLRME